MLRFPNLLWKSEKIEKEGRVKSSLMMLATLSVEENEDLTIAN